MLTLTVAGPRSGIGASVSVMSVLTSAFHSTTFILTTSLMFMPHDNRLIQIRNTFHCFFSKCKLIFRNSMENIKLINQQF